MEAKTIVNQDIGRQVNGYMVNTVPDQANRLKIAAFQRKLIAQFGDTLWVTPPETLHITLMDWIAPLVDYDEDKDDLFKRLFPVYDGMLTKVIANQKPIIVHFDTLQVAPGAIILIGHDSGTFQDIRRGFLEKVDLLPKTKRPPTIIHSTIARFKTAQDLQPIVDFVGEHALSFDHNVPYFRLVQENVAPMLKYRVIKRYHLSQ